MLSESASGCVWTCVACKNLRFLSYGDLACHRRGWDHIAAEAAALAEKKGRDVYSNALGTKAEYNTIGMRRLSLNLDSESTGISK